MSLALAGRFFTAELPGKLLPYTGWVINNRNLFLTVLEFVKSKTKVPIDLLSSENPAYAQMADFSLCPPWQTGRGCPLGSCRRALIPFIGAPPS